jgi:hypothetical protein
MARIKILLNIIKLKINATSITETIVAASIIIIVFTITFFSLNNILQNKITNSTSEIDQVINEITYLNNYEKLSIPDSYNKGNWFISLSKENINEFEYITIEAVHKSTHKKIHKKILRHNYEKD